jgi:hypothetical protein
MNERGAVRLTVGRLVLDLCLATYSFRVGTPNSGSGEPQSEAYFILSEVGLHSEPTGLPASAALRQAVSGHGRGDSLLSNLLVAAPSTDIVRDSCVISSLFNARLAL